MWFPLGPFESRRRSGAAFDLSTLVLKVVCAFFFQRENFTNDGVADSKLAGATLQEYPTEKSRDFVFGAHFAKSSLSIMVTDPGESELKAHV